MSILPTVRRYFVIMVFFLLLLIHAIQDIRLFSWSDYTRYSTYLKSILLIISLLSLCAVVGVKTKAAIKTSAGIWAITFTALFAAVLFQAIYINPEGIFPWNQIPVHVVGAARAAKLDLYNRLDKKPEIVVLGSSRAHMLPAGYLSQNLGRSVFNWSVEGGGPVDALTIAKFLVDRQDPPPAVFIVEISMRLDSYSWQERTPVVMLPYLPSGDIMLQALKAEISTIPSYTTFAESSFTYLYIYRRYAGSLGSFQPDGTSVGEKPVVPWGYQEALGVEGPQQRLLLKYNYLMPEGEDAVNELVQLADLYHFGIIFYISPLNSDFLDSVDFNDPANNNSLNRIDAFMAGIIADHPNIRFLNLLKYKPMGDLREKGFVDIVHINKMAAQQLADVLTPEIAGVLIWATGIRKNQ